MRKLILHIGAHKTGTSALQVYMKRNADLLAQWGWKTDLAASKAVNHGQLFSYAAEGDSVSFSLKTRVFERAVRSMAEQGGDFILSAEGFFLLDAADVARVAALLRPVFEDIRIIVYLRRQDQMALSLKAQGAKTIQSALLTGLDDAALPELNDKLRWYLDYAPRLEQWAAAFPQARLEVCRYDRKALAEGDIITDFFRRLGVAGEIPKLDVEVNPSLGGSEVRFVYLLRRAGLTQGQVRALRLGGVIETSKDDFLPGRDQARAMAAAFAESNKGLSKYLGGTEFFDDDFGKYPDQTDMPPLDPDYVQRNLLAIIRTMAESGALPSDDGDAAPEVMPVRPPVVLAKATGARKARAAKPAAAKDESAVPGPSAGTRGGKKAGGRAGAGKKAGARAGGKRAGAAGGGRRRRRQAEAEPQA